MSVGFDRFVRVLSGGKFVSDKLVDVRSGKIDAALSELEKEIERLRKSTLESKELDDKVADFRRRRDEIVNSDDSNGEKCEALEPLKIEVRNALAEFTNTVNTSVGRAPELLKQQGLVDTALGTATKAVNEITVHGIKNPINQKLTPLTVRANTIKTSSDVSTMETSISDAPALIRELGLIESEAKSVQAEIGKRDTQKGLVNAALQKAQIPIGGITVVGVKGPLDQTYNALAGRRDQLVNAATLVDVQNETGNAAALIRDIGTLESDAIAAKNAVAERDRQQNLADAPLGRAKVLIDGITVPFLQEPLDLEHARLTGIRDGIANAATLSAIATAMLGAPALISDSGTLETNAGTAKLESDGIAVQRSEIATDIGLAQQWIDVISDTGKKSIVNGKLALLTQREVASASLTDLTALKLELTAIINAIPAIRTEAIEEAAAGKKVDSGKWLKVTEDWVEVVNGISATNPLKAQLVLLRNEYNGIASVTDKASAYNKYQDVDNKFSDLYNAAKAAYEKNTAIAAKCDKIEVGLRSVEEATIADPITLKLTAIRDSVIPGFQGAATAAALTLKLGQIEGKADALSIELQNARANAINVTAKKAEINKSLADIQTAIDEITGDTTELEGKLLLLTNRKSSAFGLTNVANQKRELMSLGADALTLLAEAHKAGFKEKLSTPQGKQELDELIENLGKETADPQSEAMCRAALEARFKLTFATGDGMITKRLPKLYKLFCKVPDDHVGHDKLERLEFGTEPFKSGNYYQKASARIALGGMPEDKTPYTFEDDAGNKITAQYYSATTLHEIGHAVDEKKGIMSSHMNTAGFGKWKVATPEDAAQAHCDAGFVASFTGGAKKPTATDLKALLVSLLKTGAATKPASATAALGSLRDDWDTIMADPHVTACKEVRVAKQPWNGGIAKANAVKAGSTVYHEAYADTWYSYDAGERAANGVSSYQWRAPGEWFAEIYALHYLKKKDAPTAVKALF